jgi:hypothetical protein
VFAAELWSPATQTFSIMASSATPRNYHSVAVRSVLSDTLMISPLTNPLALMQSLVGLRHTTGRARPCPFFAMSLDNCLMRISGLA